MEKPSKELLEKWHQDPNNWKCGIFYYNIEDKRIFPPKRIAWQGWTINFANKRSIITFIVILTIILIIIYFIPYKKH